MNKLFSWCRKKMTKENMIVLALSGVLLMVVAIPTGKEKNKTDESKSVQLDTQTVTMDSESNSAQQEAMEEKLAQFLSRMEGAGRGGGTDHLRFHRRTGHRKGDAVCHEFADE